MEEDYYSWSEEDDEGPYGVRPWHYEEEHTLPLMGDPPWGLVVPSSIWGVFNQLNDALHEGAPGHYIRRMRASLNQRIIQWRAMTPRQRTMLIRWMGDHPLENPYHRPDGLWSALPRHPSL